MAMAYVIMLYCKIIENIKKKYTINIFYKTFWFFEFNYKKFTLNFNYKKFTLNRTTQK